MKSLVTLLTTWFVQAKRCTYQFKIFFSVISVSLSPWTARQKPPHFWLLSKTCCVQLHSTTQGDDSHLPAASVYSYVYCFQKWFPGPVGHGQMEIWWVICRNAGPAPAPAWLPSRPAYKIAIAGYQAKGKVAVMLAFQAFLAFLLTVLLTLRRHHQGCQTAAVAGLYTNTDSLAGKIARMPAHTPHAHTRAHTPTAKLSQNRTAAHGAVCLTDSYGGYLGEVHHSTSEILQMGVWQQKTPSFFYWLHFYCHLRALWSQRSTTLKHTRAMMLQVN